MQTARRGFGLIAGALCSGSAFAQITTGHSTAMHREGEFLATPAQKYGILPGARQFAGFTMDTAETRAQPGGEFRSMLHHVVRPPGRDWRPASWTAGLCSIVKFELTAHAADTRVPPAQVPRRVPKPLCV